jgi:tetratricopeptide (TPR) repeat protein
MSINLCVAAGETAVAPAEKWAVLAWVMSGAHFTEPSGFFMRVFTRAALILALAFVAGRGACAADSDWPDVEGRIQYGFYTEDVRTLADVVSQLSGPASGDDPLQHYYVGLANYRLATVLAAKDKGRAREAAARCVSHLDVAVSAKSEFAEGLALQSACLRALGNLALWKPLAGAKSNGQMERAVKLAPKDPRVLLLQALENGEGGKIDADAIVKLKKAAAAFEAERQGVDRTPGWGAAEAYAYLGRGYLDQGDVVAARDALERALLIAPDFVMARKLLTRITSG